MRIPPVAAEARNRVPSNRTPLPKNTVAKKAVLQLTEAVAQDTDKPQECNPSERYQVHRQPDRRGIGVQPGARFLRIGRNREAQKHERCKQQEGEQQTCDSSGAGRPQTRYREGIICCHFDHQAVVDCVSSDRRKDKQFYAASRRRMLNIAFMAATARATAADGRSTTT
jgi:hypothetical protein